MIEILKSPWDKQFFDLVRDAKKDILMSSPFIKMHPINTFVKSLSHNPKIRVLTSFKLTYFRRNVSDIEAIEKLVKISDVRNVGNLHSKVYIFDKTDAVITSSNLTYGGLTKNFEYGVIISDKKLVEKIYDDFFTLFTDRELSGLITRRVVLEVKKILDRMPSLEIPDNQREILNFNDILNREEVNILEEELSPWQKDIFDILSRTKEKIIRLDQLYEYERELKTKHPRNMHIKAKIRQQLQQLRDKGLIEFIERGIYKKLW